METIDVIMSLFLSAVFLCFFIVVLMSFWIEDIKFKKNQKTGN